MRSMFVIVNTINRMTPIFLQQLAHPCHYCRVDLDCPCYAITPKTMIQGLRVLHSEMCIQVILLNVDFFHTAMIELNRSALIKVIVYKQ